VRGDRPHVFVGHPPLVVLVVVVIVIVIVIVIVGRLFVIVAALPGTAVRTLAFFVDGLQRTRKAVGVVLDGREVDRQRHELQQVRNDRQNVQCSAARRASRGGL
jgi:uncharacterized membrane protein YqiK